MAMKFTEELMERIEINKDAKLKNGKFREGLGINLKNTLGGQTSVFKNNWEICDIMEITQMIYELTDLRDAILEETGIRF